MITTLLLLAALLLLLPMLLNLLITLDGKQKIAIYVVVVLLVALAAGYEYQEGSQQEKNRDAVLGFMQGRTILCLGQEVNSVKFNYVSGTQSFVGKPDSDAKGVLFRAQECQVAP